MKVVNLEENFKLLSEHWSPKVVAELDSSYVKLAKYKGEFVWHKHDLEDELFLVVKGKLLIQFRDKDVYLNPGELLIVPKGVEHKPVAKDEVHIVLLRRSASCSA